MTSFKRKAAALVAICITAILGIAVCGCDDLGAYSDTEEYYDSFDDIIFIGGAAGSGKEYSVEEYFYNKDSRDDFLTGEDGTYSGVEHSDYVYVAIPLNKCIQMDSLAMYLQAKNDVALYINVYVVDEDEIPTNWKEIEGSDISGDESAEVTEENLESKTEKALGTLSETETETEGEADEYDDPDPKSRIGEITVHLKGGKWNSFVLDFFRVNDKVEKSIHVEKGQCILLQIRNNGGVRVFDDKNNVYVDPQTGLVLEKAEITMTNLLVRALNLENETEVEEGSE